MSANDRERRPQGAKLIHTDAHWITAVGHHICEPARLERAESVALANQVRRINGVEANGGRDIDRMLRPEDAGAFAG